jgi:DNA-binding PadR family transcriptional regulator
MPSPVVLGQFEQAVLVTLVHLRGEAYGRAILTEVQRRLARDVSAGAVYATLERLEAKGLASSTLAPGTAIRGGRARRYFVPTPAGVRALNEAKSASDVLWHGLAWPLKVRT